MTLIAAWNADLTISSLALEDKKDLELSPHFDQRILAKCELHFYSSSTWLCIYVDYLLQWETYFQELVCGVGLCCDITNPGRNVTFILTIHPLQVTHTPCKIFQYLLDLLQE